MTDSAEGSEDSTDLEVILEIACNVADTLEEAVGLGDEDLLRVALLTLERVQVEESVEVSLLVTDDEGLRELNRDFRGRDEATDVLSFPLLDTPLIEAPADELWQPAEQGVNGASFAHSIEPDAGLSGDDLGAAGFADADEQGDGEDVGDDDEDFEDAPLHLGDIAISRDAVVRQAAAAGHSVAWECAYLFAHGLLHLMGYDDSTDAGYRAMVAHQEAILTEAHIAR
ncbi:MAG: rRNA maturation RNase YbeY [Nitrososphaerota archaeon]